MFEVTVPEVFRHVPEVFRHAKVWNLMQELNVPGPVKMQRPLGIQAGVGQIRENGEQNVLCVKKKRLMEKIAQFPLRQTKTPRISMDVQIQELQAVYGVPQS